MRQLTRVFLLLTSLAFLGFFFLRGNSIRALSGPYNRIDGFSITPSRIVPPEKMKPIKETGANWISILPYAYTVGYTPKLRYDTENEWWGESTPGVIDQFHYAREEGLSVMLKPHVYVQGEGWIGDFELNSEAEWLEWEGVYRGYIMKHARLADSLGIPMLCVGTEMRKAVRNRPEFWSQLIREVREIYSGKLTYAANWDCYQEVTFWDQLDYIGIDAYFPLTEKHSPDVEHLLQSWQRWHDQIERFSIKEDRPVLFTEYGYLAIPRATWNTWEVEHKLGDFEYDPQTQQNAYEALYQTFWEEEWFAGGFAWIWSYEHKLVGPNINRNYTPQGKPALETIRGWYMKDHDE